VERRCFKEELWIPAAQSGIVPRDEAQVLGLRRFFLVRWQSDQLSTSEVKDWLQEPALHVR